MVILLFLIPVIIIVFIVCTRERTEDNEPVLKMLKESIRPLYENIDNLKFYSNGKESFTRNKQTVHICLKDKHGKYYPINSLMYVTLHELAHVIYRGDSSHHPPEYVILFEELLKRAEAIGIYNPSQKFEDEYCGLSS